MIDNRKLIYEFISREGSVSVEDVLRHIRSTQLPGNELVGVWEGLEVESTPLGEWFYRHKLWLREATNDGEGNGGLLVGPSETP